MKSTSFSIIFLTMLGLFLVGCESSDGVKSVTNNGHKIDYREPCDGCEDCEVDECCCSVTLVDGAAADLFFCGTECGGTECGPIEANDCVISGFTLPISLSSSGPVSAIFCMDQNEAFSLYTTTLVPPTVRITCQVGQTNPNTVQLTLNTPGNKAYYTVTDECILASCL